MKEAANKASISHDMSTKNRGSILPAERGVRDHGRRGRGSRDAFRQPEDFTPGDNGMVGGGDPCNQPNCITGNFDDVDPYLL